MRVGVVNTCFSCGSVKSVISTRAKTNVERTSKGKTLVLVFFNSIHPPRVGRDISTITMSVERENFNPLSNIFKTNNDFSQQICEKSKRCFEKTAFVKLRSVSALPFDKSRYLYSHLSVEEAHDAYARFYR